jgi:hypothetical protein
MASNPRSELVEAFPAEIASQTQSPENVPAAHVSNEDIATGSDAEARRQAIARAAYFLAEARAFEPGHELDDWLTAEQQISLS